MRADDLGFDDMGFRMELNGQEKQIDTKNVDKLAREGLVLDSCASLQQSAQRRRRLTPRVCLRRLRAVRVQPVARDVPHGALPAAPRRERLDPAQLELRHAGER